MYPDSLNIYQKARDDTGYTQEQAAELLNLSVESIRAYENNKRVPPEPVVLKMCNIYRCKELGYYHLRKNAVLAKEMIPNIAITNLPVAVLHLLKEVTDLVACRDQLIEITCDGKISPQERLPFNQILAELDDVSNAIFALKYSKELE